MTLSTTEFVNPEEFARDVKINVHDLSKHFCEQATLFAYYATKAHQAQTFADGKKQLMGVANAQIAKSIRDEAAAEGKKITEAAIAQAIEIHPDYVRARRTYNEAQGIADLAKTYLEALKQRRDMLIQLGAKQRDEMKGDMSMKAASPNIAAYEATLASRNAADKDAAPENN